MAKIKKTSFIAVDVEGLVAAAPLAHAEAGVVAKDRRLAEHGYLAVGCLGVGRPHVTVVLQVVLGLEDRRVVDPPAFVTGSFGKAQPLAWRPLALAPPHAVTVVAGGLATLMWTVPGGTQETEGPHMRGPCT